MTQIATTLGTLPDIPGLPAAMDKVRAWGAAHGTESMVILDPQGKELAFSTGTADEVQLPTAFHLEDCPGYFFVHNHPTACPLSINDIMMVSTRYGNGICATLPAGGFDIAYNLKEPQGTEYYRVMSLIDLCVASARLLQTNRGFTQEEAYGSLGHLDMLALTKMGIVTDRAYRYDPGIAEAVEKLMPYLPPTVAALLTAPTA